MSCFLEVSGLQEESRDAIGQRALDGFAGMEGAEYRDRFDGRHSKRRRHVRGNGGETEYLDVKLFTGGFDSL